MFDDADFFFHEVGCRSSTIPTTCRECGRKVFFFSCSCGSKVYFDELGGDWPKHDCSDQSRSTRGRKFKSSNNAPLIPPDHDEMYAIPGEEGTLKGVIWEVCQDCDPFAHFRVERGLMSSLVLGELARQPLGQLSIRVQREKHVEFFLLWTPKNLILKKQLRKGVPVFARVRAVDVQDRECVWYCENVNVEVK